MIDRMLINSLFKKRLRLLDNKKKLYQIPKSVDEIYQYQINHFNNIWCKAVVEIPFYQFLYGISFAVYIWIKGECCHVNR